MSGDCSRSTHDPKKQYSKVNLQQGRVLVDADWNEQMEILNHYERKGLIEVIGQSGFPKNVEDSFMIGLTLDKSSFTIHSGRYYVDGILVENLIENGLDTVDAIHQPNLPLFKNHNLALPAQPGKYIAYLDVWEQHITELDDPNIKESALGGADSSTRNKIVWQVKLLDIRDDISKLHGGDYGCETSFDSWDNLAHGSAGTLKARTTPQIPTTNPYKLRPGAGYRRQENQLYRIEIHRPGGVAGKRKATFKWSRDNGAIVTSAKNISQKSITVTGIGKDRLLGFDNQQWGEVTDTRHELLCLPGTLVKLNVVSETEFAIDGKPIGDDALTNEDYPQEWNPKVRRWDSEGDIPLVGNEDFVEIEDGIEVSFGAGEYRTGDYWLIPARTLNADIEWPRNDDGTPVEKTPEGIRHHFAKLAILDVEVNGTTTKISNLIDCRKPFPPLTDLPSSTMIHASVHGNVAVIDTASEQNLHRSQLKLDVSRTTGGTELKLVGNLPQDLLQPSLLVHFPISASFLSADKSSFHLTKINVSFETKNCSVSPVSIMDGSVKVVYEKKLKPRTNIGGNTWEWELLNPIKIISGLGISVEVGFGKVQQRKVQQNRQITFSAAGAIFKQST
jgi:hypothetical protein